VPVRVDRRLGCEVTPVVAAAQATPMFLYRDATVEEKVIELTAKAAEEGAGFSIFPETFLPPSPDWVRRAPAWSDRPFAERLAAESVTVPSAQVRSQLQHTATPARHPLRPPVHINSSSFAATCLGSAPSRMTSTAAWECAWLGAPAKSSLSYTAECRETATHRIVS
jgi:hypothetical protein